MKKYKEILAGLEDAAAAVRPSNKKLITKLAKLSPKELDNLALKTHESVFAEHNCMKCANCCKVGTPTFKESDVKRLALFLGLKPAEFKEKYTKIDDVNDRVLKKTPCVFLKRNMCSVYEARPSDCRNYPHTDKKGFHNNLEVTLGNTKICPAVFDIFEKLKANL